MTFASCSWSQKVQLRIEFGSVTTAGKAFRLSYPPQLPGSNAVVSCSSLHCSVLPRLWPFSILLPVPSGLIFPPQHMYSFTQALWEQTFNSLADMSLWLEVHSPARQRRWKRGNLKVYKIIDWSNIPWRLMKGPSHSRNFVPVGHCLLWVPQNSPPHFILERQKTGNFAFHIFPYKSTV